MTLHSAAAASTDIHRAGENFSQEALLKARADTFRFLDEAAAAMKPGLTEEAAYEWLKRGLEASGFGKSWHRPYVRFGKNTLKGYGDPSEPGVVLGPDDIFYIDIGPVKDGYEGDAGLTGCTGTDPLKNACARDVKVIFERVKARWVQGGVTGIQLYELAAQDAQSLGWILNLDINGHRLSDFPHAAYFKGNLAEVAVEAKPYAWVLEIQIRHPSEPFGGFYEDLLY